MRPLEGLLVLEFAQFLAGPSAGLRLSDLGARVIKIERPVTGDIGRTLYMNRLKLDGDSTLFHSINRNKQSFAADLKDPDDRARLNKLIERADVMIENFRPGVMERLGLDYAAVRAVNPRIVYATVTGYGRVGAWREKPGQDLLAQSLSGITYLNGDADHPPTPIGLSVADLITGAHLVQGILASLVRRGISGEGARVEVSLIESIIDLQFETFSTYLNDGGQLPQRSAVQNSNAYLAAPYGIYATANGYLALAMGSILRLGELLECPPLLAYTDPDTWFTQRDEIKRVIAAHVKTRTTEAWLSVLEPADYWCAKVQSWDDLVAHDGFRILDMLQTVSRGAGMDMLTTRCPIRIDGEIYKSPKGAPRVGEDTQKIIEEFGL